MSYSENDLIIPELNFDRELAGLIQDGLSPEVIETLLCEVGFPFSEEASTLWLAGGQNMVQQRDGTEAATAWGGRLQRQIRDHRGKINDEVTSFYHVYPDMLEQVPERFWNTTVPKREPDGYTPDYRPEEQGLGSLEDELIRTGLLADTRRWVRMAYLFDIDGPVTDPSQKKVIFPQLLDKLAVRMIGGEPLGLNTGRATAWAMERVVAPLESSLKHHIRALDLDSEEATATFNEALHRFCVIGEKGGDWVTFDRKGQPRFGLSQQLETPDDVGSRVRELVETKYQDTMFLDPQKRTMTTIEMKDGHDRDEFEHRQQELKAEVQEILENGGHDRDFRVLTTPIATDIESVHVGKALGAQRICEWLRRLRLKPERYLAFGDDESDMDMARYLKMVGRQVKFVNVGRQPLFSHEFTVILSPGDSFGSLRVMHRPEQ